MKKRIVVWGLGHVGLITSLFLCEKGYTVYGIDKNYNKIKKIYSGDLGFNALSTRIKRIIDLGLLKIGDDYSKIPSRFITTFHFICVDTPNHLDGAQDLSNVFGAANSIINMGIKENDVIILRSTVLPLTSKDIIQPYIKSNEKQKNKYDLVVNPCFARGNEIDEDLRNSNRVVIGSESNIALEKMEELYEVRSDKFVFMSCTEAELTKYVDNCFHALKVSFANEVDLLADSLNCRSENIMNSICMDKRLNISNKYLLPGKPFEGKCLPKDIKAIESYISKQNLDLPILRNINNSNDKYKAGLIDENSVLDAKNKMEVLKGLSCFNDVAD